MAEENKQGVNIKITDDVLSGVYANMMMVAHNQEEFVLDFMNVWQPQGIITARVVTNPGHFKRMVAALTDNLKKYEDQFGKIDTKASPPGNPTESSKFGF